MPLPTNRTTANTAAEHVADHNTGHATLNTLEGHPADTTAVHGIADTTVLATDAEVAAAVATHAATPHGSLAVQDEGSALTQRTTLNFTGAGVVVTDDAPGLRTKIHIAGGGSGGRDELDARDYGTVGVTTDWSGPLNQMYTDVAGRVLPGSDPSGVNTPRGTTLYFPRGLITFTNPITGGEKSNTVTVRGEGGRAAYSGHGATVFRYTGSGQGAFWRIGSSNYHTIAGIHVEYTNPAFTGYLITQDRYHSGQGDQGGDTAGATYTDFMATGTEVSYLADSLIFCNSSHNTVIRDGVLMNAPIGVRGMPNVVNDYCNGLLIENVVFLNTVAACANVHQSLTMRNNILEGIRQGLWNGSATIYRPLQHMYRDYRPSGSNLMGAKFDGNWCGDVAGQVQTDVVWLQIGDANWQGCDVAGNSFVDGATVINIGGASSEGVFIHGNTHPVDQPQSVRVQNVAGSTRCVARANYLIEDFG